MALVIDDPEASRLAEALAKRTGETPTEAVVNAVREKLARAEVKAAETQRMLEGARQISRDYRSRPLVDARTPEEILGYDENGLPT